MKWIAILLFLGSFILRIFYLNAGLFHYDGVLLAEQISSGNIFENSFLKQRAGYVLIIYGLAKILPFHIDNIILFSNAFFGSASVVLLYFLAKLFFNEKEAIYASTLFSVSPLFLSVTTYAKEHGAEVFFLLLSLLMLMCAKKTIDFVYASAVCSYFLFVKETAFLFIPLIVLTLFLYKKTNKFNAVIFLLPFLIMFLVYFITALYGDIFSPGLEHPALQFSQRLVEAFKAVVYSITWPGLPFLFLGIFVLYKSGQYKNLFFLLFWLVLFFFFGNHRLFSPRWLSPLLPAAFILISLGVARIKHINAAIIIAIVIISLTFIHPVLAYRHETGGIKAFALKLKEISPENSLILIYGDQCEFIKYYSKRECSPNDPGVKTSTLIQFSLEKNKSVYLIGHFEKNYDVAEHINPFLKYLEHKYIVKELGDIEFEDYHKAELGLRKIKTKLIQLQLNKKEEV